MASISPRVTRSQDERARVQRQTSNPSNGATTRSAAEAAAEQNAAEPVDLNMHEQAPAQSSPSSSPVESGQIGAQATTEGDTSNIGEPRKCWICLTNETEDTPLSSEWRSPCPCALTAHEACLLDWIADLQSPSNRKRSGNSKVLCPQCKSEIIVARPRSVVVDAVNSMERLAGNLMIPGVIGALGGCVVTGCFIYGVNAVYVVFGEEEARRILGAEGSLTRNIPQTQVESDFWIICRTLSPFAAYSGWNWRVGIGLPLIPVTLVLSRTRLADYVLPVLPIIFFASQNPELERIDLNDWHPSASLSLAVLPYVRGAYNELYERLFGESERRWQKEVQPHHGDEEGDQSGEGEEGAARERHDDMHEEDVMMEFNIEVDVVEEVQEDEADEQAVNDAQRDGQEGVPGVPRVPQRQDGEGENVPAGEEAAAVQAEAQHPAQRANNIIVSTGRLANTVFGALLFPAISAAMGGILKLALPRSWTTVPPSAPIYSIWGKSSRANVTGHGPITSVLQARWGRSIVGGCLFVVLKDAIVLYYRWKLAQTHRQRRVLDYDKKQKRKRSGAEAAS